MDVLNEEKEERGLPPCRPFRAEIVLYGEKNAKKSPCRLKIAERGSGFYTRLGTTRGKCFKRTSIQGKVKSILAFYMFFEVCTGKWRDACTIHLPAPFNEWMHRQNV